MRFVADGAFDRVQGLHVSLANMEFSRNSSRKSSDFLSEADRPLARRHAPTVCSAISPSTSRCKQNLAQALRIGSTSRSPCTASDPSLTPPLHAIDSRLYRPASPTYLAGEWGCTSCLPSYQYAAISAPRSSDGHLLPAMPLCRRKSGQAQGTDPPSPASRALIWKMVRI